MSAGREPPLAFAFMLLATVLAVVTMHVLGTPLLDFVAYRLGVGVAAASGLATGLIVRAMHRRARIRKLAWAFIPIAGACVAMGIQLILLMRAPTERTYILASGITTGEPMTWIFAGAPFGALPALVAAAALALAMRVVGAAPAEDMRERMMLPFAAVCAILGSVTLAMVSIAELPIAAGIVFVAALGLFEIRYRDRARMRWLAGVFAGKDPEHVLVPISEMTGAGADVPNAVGAVPPECVIVRIEEPRGYRAQSRTAVATTGLVLEAAIAPLLRRRNALGAALASTAAVVIVALFAR